LLRRHALKLSIKWAVSSAVEQRTFNPLAEGSNPSRPTNKIKGLQIVVTVCDPCFFVIVINL
jgi:hypothetical protein